MNYLNVALTNIQKEIAMDEFNNNNNNNENQNFGEESFAEQERRSEQQGQYDPYNMPLGQQNVNPQPMQQQYQQYQQNQQGSYDTSYAGQRQVPPNFDPYKQPLPQNPYGGGMYCDANGMPYKTGLATASLVLGIISLVLTFTSLIFIPPLGIIPIIGIILGCVYKGKHQPVGKGASTAGIICSAVSLVLCVLFLVLCVYLVMNYMPEMMDFLKSYSPEMYDEYYDMFHDMYPEWFNTVAALFSRFFVK
ncbi:MAG: hypothetical protein ACI4I1_03800 [Oscillospiraceae bacterium]